MSLYTIVKLVDGEWDTLETGYDSRKGTSDYWLYVTYGVYIPKPTAAELQKTTGRLPLRMERHGLDQPLDVP